MATSRVLDHLQNFKFHLLDVSLHGIGIIPVPVFTPVLGFSEISAPEMTAEVEEIKEGNSEFPRKVIKRGGVSTITLKRGSEFYDSDFWRWTISCIKGAGSNSRRRTLILVQFMNMDLWSIKGAVLGGGLATSTAISLLGQVDIAQMAAIELGLVGAGAALGLIPAKAWMLQDCMATRFKSGSDFDGSGGEVSVQELDLEAEWFEEFSMGA